MKIVSEDKSWLEWLVFGLSSVLIVAVVGFLVSDAVQDAHRPPDIRVTMGRPVQSPHGYTVMIAATNTGDETAQEVEIEISHEGENPEEATLTFDFLSSGEVREGWAGFSGKPDGPLTARVVGYRSE